MSKTDVFASVPNRQVPHWCATQRRGNLLRLGVGEGFDYCEVKTEEKDRRTAQAISGIRIGIVLNNTVAFTKSIDLTAVINSKKLDEPATARSKCLDIN